MSFLASSGVRPDSEADMHILYGIEASSGYDIMEKRLDVEKNILFAEVRGQSVDLVAADDQPRRM